MRGEEADERDSSWESHAPRFRLFVFEGPDAAVRTVDIVEASIEEALEAAGPLSHDGADLWSLALVVDGAPAGRGLVWLSGMDYHDRPVTGAEWRARARMQDRYLAARVRRGEPILLPNGLRVIRVFPEWGTRWPLWESFSDAYLLDPSDLGLSTELADDLAAWNAAWQDRREDEELPDAAAWRARGEALVARLRDELAGVAEVRPGFLP